MYSYRPPRHVCSNPVSLQKTAEHFGNLPLQGLYQSDRLQTATLVFFVYGNNGSILHEDHGEERDFVLHIVGTTTTTSSSDTDTGVTNDNTGKTYKSVSQCVMDPMSGQYKVHVTTPIDTIEVKIILRHYHPRCGTNQNVENDNGTVDTQDPSAVAALLKDKVQFLPHIDFFQFGDATMVRPSAFQRSGSRQHSTTLSSL